jgi:hypothetical protein
MAAQKVVAKPVVPEVLPDVATQPHPEAPVEPDPARFDARADKLKENPKDRLETRPKRNLPTPLDPASPEARGYPIDPRVDNPSD